MKILTRLGALLMFSLLIWAVGCAALSFITWTNFFVISVADWSGLARGVYLAVIFIGGCTHIDLEGLPR